MANHRDFKDDDPSLDPEDVNSEPTGLAANQRAPEDTALPPHSPDPNDVVPVPPAMSAAEVDKRSEVVEELREESSTQKEPKRDDDSGMR